MTETTSDSRTVVIRAAFELLVISFVVLFQELTLIRWLPGQVRVLAYFPNLVLISAFLGLGIGSLRAGRRSLLPLWPAGLLALVAAAWGASGIVFTQESTTEHLWLLYYDLPAGAPVVAGVRFPIVIAFILTAISFVPLGQAVAERLRLFRRHSSSLWGYCWDLGGSLVGVIGFSLASFLGTFPWVWFSVLLVGGTVLFARSRRALVYLAAGALVLALVVAAERASFYSPYYALDTSPAPEVAGVGIQANGSFHQAAASLGRGTPAVDSSHARLREDYRIPYAELERAPRRVLILGAGSGNDVAVALEEGAESVDAVEIDPVILELGRQLHPDRPWSSPRVRAIVTDARSFLDNNDGPYDLVVFGTLDSMTRLSALSNVRLDNFVYTEECLRRVREILAPDGGVAMYFMVGQKYISLRLFGLLARTFGKVPRVVRVEQPHLFSHVFLAGPAFPTTGHVSAAEETEFFESVLPSVEVPDDGWPFLYLKSRSVSSFYLSLIVAFTLLAVVAVAVASPEMRGSILTRQGIDLEMFLFGLAFLLMETRFVTEMSLVWGATWLTSAVVFGSILGTILLATVWMQLRPMPWIVATVGLVGSLLATYLVPTELLVGRSTAASLGLSVLFVGTPIFFASACFALRFKTRAAVELAFGWNLIGAVAGGLLEFSSMALGIKALSLQAVTAYLIAFLLFERERRRSSGRARGES